MVSKESEKCAPFFLWVDGQQAPCIGHKAESVVHMGEEALEFFHADTWLDDGRVADEDVGREETGKCSVADYFSQLYEDCVVNKAGLRAWFGAVCALVMAVAIGWTEVIRARWG